MNSKLLPSHLSQGPTLDDEYFIFDGYSLEETDDVLVAEDNDGSHELEIGEAPLADTYISKRDYEQLPIDQDIEWGKYDAMVGKLFEVRDKNDCLYEWTDLQLFKDSIREIFQDLTL